MSGIEATAHIIGGLAVIFAVGLIGHFIGLRSGAKIQSKLYEEIALSEGISVNKLKSLDDEIASKMLVSHIKAKYSDDRVRNRISDMLHPIFKWWTILEELLAAGFFLWVIWITIFESLSDAVVVWFVIAVLLASRTIRAVLRGLAVLTLGSFPGEPKAYRKVALSTLEESERKYDAHASDGRG